MEEDLMRTWLFNRRGANMILAALLLVIGCAGSPPDMTEEEWYALTPEERAEAAERKKQLEQYDADAFRCRREAERKIGVKYPVAMNTAGKTDISMGIDREQYRRCMEEAGWELPVIIDKTRTGDEGK
jgi:hypothetical protein